MGDATDKRTCRVCGKQYDYPVPRTHATRTACDARVTIPEDVTRALSTLRGRIDRLSREVERLKQDGQDS